MSYAKSEIHTPEDIAKMSLTEIGQNISKKNDLRNLVYHYNTTRKEGEPSLSVSDTFPLHDPREGTVKYRIVFDHRTNDDGEPQRSVVQLRTFPEVRGFILALLALRPPK